MPWFGYLLKRLVLALPVVACVSLIGFFLMRYDFAFGPLDIPKPGGDGHWRVIERVENPVDPLAALRNNPQISPEAIEKERQRLGLDKPFWEQYRRWLAALFAGDSRAPLRGEWSEFWQPNLGTTNTGESVAALMLERAGNTLLLNMVVFTLTWLIALPLGIQAAVRQGSWLDRALAVLASGGMAMPAFVLALILAVVVVQTGWLPYGGLVGDGFAWASPLEKLADIAGHLVLPVIVLTLGGIAILQRQMRGNLLEVLGQEYVRSARARGLPEGRVVYRHVVRVAINPLITLMGYEFAALLSGALLVETVLDYPGLGQLTYKAVLEGDTNLVMASLILSCLMLVAGNLVADLLLRIADPRVKA